MVCMSSRPERCEVYRIKIGCCFGCPLWKNDPSPQDYVERFFRRIKLICPHGVDDTPGLVRAERTDSEGMSSREHTYRLGESGNAGHIAALSRHDDTQAG